MDLKNWEYAHLYHNSTNSLPYIGLVKIMIPKEGVISKVCSTKSGMASILRGMYLTYKNSLILLVCGTHSYLNGNFFSDYESFYPKDIKEIDGFYSNDLGVDRLIRESVRDSESVRERCFRNDS